MEKMKHEKIFEFSVDGEVVTHTEYKKADSNAKTITYRLFAQEIINSNRGLKQKYTKMLKEEIISVIRRSRIQHKRRSRAFKRVMGWE